MKFGVHACVFEVVEKRFVKLRVLIRSERAHDEPPQSPVHGIDPNVCKRLSDLHLQIF